MNIISHRGYWCTDEEKNTEVAFERSFSLGFGTETDLRDRNGELVIAHDLSTESDLSFKVFCDIYLKNTGKLLLAINIKADGLATKLKESLERHGINNYFLFDMSVPDLRVSLAAGLICFTRVSDVETEPCYYGACKGIWLDGFYSDWYRSKDLFQFLRDGKQVCLVSSELHKRDPMPLWRMLKDAGMHREPQFTLCTDRPESAKLYFFDGVDA
jgi:hypothetical protein